MCGVWVRYILSWGRTAAELRGKIYTPTAPRDDLHLLLCTAAEDRLEGEDMERGSRTVSVKKMEMNMQIDIGHWIYGMMKR